MDLSRPPSGLADGVLRAVSYADVFDWPLTVDEVHRFLPVVASPADIDAALRSAELAARVDTSGAFVHLRGRADNVARRCEREANAIEQWPDALRFARAVAAVPGARFVGVTGSLAAGAPTRDADVDLFIITIDGRLWLTRAMVIVVVRWARQHVVTLCPNFIVAETALALDQHDAFTAHELMQLVPLHGSDAYQQLLARNGWYRDHLPNHPGHDSVAPLPGRRVRPIVERLLRMRIFSPIERWEMRRKTARLTRSSLDPARSEVHFDATMCKGHFEGHRQRVLDEYEQRMAMMHEMAP